MKKFTSLAALLVAAFSMVASPSGAHARVVVTESVKYYNITGKDGLDVSKAMLSGGERNINLRHAIASTTTRISIDDVKAGIVNGRCKVTNVTVNLDIVYLFPQWPQKSNASRNVRRAWDPFYAELEKHEHHHGAIAKDFARKIEKAMLNMSGVPALGCRDYIAKASHRFRSITAQLKQKQLAFDARENHKSSRITRLQIALLKAK